MMIPLKFLSVINRFRVRAGYERTRYKRIIDTVLILLSAPFTFVLMDGLQAPAERPYLFTLAAIGLSVYFIIGYRLRVSRQAWHNTGMYDTARLATLALSLTVITLAFSFTTSDPKLPKAAAVIYGLLVFVSLQGVRFLTRYAYDPGIRMHGKESSKRFRQVLIAGAGYSGTRIARELLSRHEHASIPIGYIDDDPTKQRAVINGLPVLGPLASLPLIADARQVDDLFISMPSADGSVIRRLMRDASSLKIKTQTLPSLGDLIDGRVSLQRLRDVGVEDLLRRPPIQLDTASISAYLSGATVLVTGAGGSIGAEIVRQISKFAPERVIMLGRGENSLFVAEEGVRNMAPNLPIETVVTDVRDLTSLGRVFERYAPSVVFHAAAHKHVGLMERSPEQAILNNVVGTKNVVDLCVAHGVRHLVNISTDKAVNPTSVMGASKRVCEGIVQLGAERHQHAGHFVSVRFGNVLGSRGSVLTVFRRQIEAGKPITVTHPDMVRYFMTIPEAAQLVIQAGGLPASAAVYVLDMGDPVRIVDLAHDFIRLAGLEPGIDVPIRFTGARPGEKLYEELLTDKEASSKTDHESIFVAPNADSISDNFEALLATLIDSAEQAQGADIRAGLQQLVSTYHPTKQLAANAATSSRSVQRAR